MYRSQSTSSVYSGALYQLKPEIPLTETPPRTSNELHFDYEPEVRSRRPEAKTPTVARSMTSAAKLPTHVGRRPLPKALLPKAARGGSAPIGGTVFRVSNQKPSSPHSPAAHRGSENSALRDSGYGSLSSDLSRVGLSAPVYSPSAPLFGGKDRRTDDYSAGKAFRFNSMEETHWYPPGNIRPLRRKDPVVEDSIYPILKAALAKDREPEDRRTEDRRTDDRRTEDRRTEDRRTEDRRTEEEVVREAFLSPSPSYPVLSSRNMYSSSFSSADDVFASSTSEAKMTSSGAGNHSKSSSEIDVLNRLSSQPHKHSRSDEQVDCQSHLSRCLHTLTAERDQENPRVFRSPESDKILADSASRTIENKNRRNLDLALDLDDECPVCPTTPEDLGLPALILPSPPIGFRDADFSTEASSSSTSITTSPSFHVACSETPPGERSFNQPPVAETIPSKISRGVHQDGERKSQSDESQSSGTMDDEGEEGEVEEGRGLELVFDIVKGPVGVGFCIEGGKGSLSGDRPITVKRIFKGGFGDASVPLLPGDELVSVGGQSMDEYSHFDAWKFIKALPNGSVQMTIRRRIPIRTLPSSNILSPPRRL